jgi:hypothetical protein
MLYSRTLQDSVMTKILKIQDCVTADCNEAVNCSIEDFKTASQMYDAHLQQLWKGEAENKSCIESLQVWRAQMYALHGELTRAPDNRMYFKVPAASSEVIYIYIYIHRPCVLYDALSCFIMLTYAELCLRMR